MSGNNEGLHTSITKISLPSPAPSRSRAPILSGAGVKGVNGKFHRVPGKLVNSAPYFKNSAGFEISLAKGQKFWAILGKNGGAYYFAAADPENMYTPPTEWNPHTLANGARPPTLTLELEQEAGYTNALTPTSLPSLELIPDAPQFSNKRRSSEVSEGAATATTVASPSPVLKMNFMSLPSPAPAHRESSGEGSLAKSPSLSHQTAYSRRTSAYSNNDSPLIQSHANPLPQRIPRQDVAQPTPATQPQPVRTLPSQVYSPQVYSSVSDYKPPGFGHMAAPVPRQVLPPSFSPSLSGLPPRASPPHGVLPPPLTYSPHLLPAGQPYYQWVMPPAMGRIPQGGPSNTAYMAQPVMVPQSLLQGAWPGAGTGAALNQGIAGQHNIFAQMGTGVMNGAMAGFAPTAPQQAAQAQQPSAPQQPATQLPSTHSGPELVEPDAERPASRAVSELGGEPVEDAQSRPRTASSAVIAPPVQEPPEQLPRFYRVEVEQGVTYRMTQNLDDKFPGQVAAQGLVVEAERQDADFIRCSNGLWLPKRIGRQPLLKAVDDEMQHYEVLVQPGISFRRSMDMEDKSKREFAKFGDRITAYRTEGDWVAIPGGLWLPLCIRDEASSKVTQLLRPEAPRESRRGNRSLEWTYDQAVAELEKDGGDKAPRAIQLQRNESRRSQISVYSG